MPSRTLKESGARGTTNEKKHDEEAAASALALLSSPTIKPPSSFGEPEPATSEASTLKDGDISESEESYTSQNEVLPKAVHTPPLNDMMVNHTYIDYSVIEEEHLCFLEEGNETTTNRIALNDEDKKATNNRVAKIRKIFGDVGPSKKNSGGVVRPFPEKLMEVLDRADMESIITWMPHGRAFIVLQPQQLRDIVLPRFFKQTKFMSFTRQLNLWGFKRITKGVDSGAYYHALFLRGRARLAMLMRRQKIKGTGIKLTPNPEQEPNFYKISESRPLPVIDPSKKESKPLPPLRQTIASRGAMDSSSAAFEYNRLLDSFGGDRIPDRNNFDQQIYPFNSAHNMSTNPLSLVTQGLGVASMQDCYSSLAQQQQRQQQHTDSQYLSFLRQKLYLEQQQQQQQEQERIRQQQTIASAEQLLNGFNSHVPNMRETMQIQELKQRLLNVASSLDHMSQPQDMMLLQQPHLVSQSRQYIPESYLSQQQQQQPPQQQPAQYDNNISVLMNALENTRNVAFATQARLEKVTRDLKHSQSRHPM